MFKPSLPFFRDLVDLICNNLELFHFCQAKIGKEKFVNLSSERRDAELKMTLMTENKLHPALFSASGEYKVRFIRYENTLLSNIQFFPSNVCENCMSLN
jgi:hypothetical protein